MLALGSAHTGLGVALLVSAFAFGFRHGIDWDHLAAITDITSSQRSVRTGLKYATLYAAGHGAVVFVIGLLAIVAGRTLPKGIDTVMARIVGATLIVLGAYVFYSLIRYGRDFRLRSRWMLIFQSVRNGYRWTRERIGRTTPVVEHAHEHLAEGDFHHDHANGGGVAVATSTHSHHHSHTDPFMNYGTGTSLGVGVLHGVGAETPTQLVIFITAAGAGGATAGVIVLSVFLLGLLASNSAVAIASATGYLAATKRFGVYATVSVVTAVASLIIGTAFLISGGTWLPAIFGG